MSNDKLLSIRHGPDSLLFLVRHRLLRSIGPPGIYSSHFSELPNLPPSLLHVIEKQKKHEKASKACAVLFFAKVTERRRDDVDANLRTPDRSSFSSIIGRSVLAIWEKR
jgi:hypothetical protein